MSWSSWARELEVAPSVYAADFLRLGAQVEALLEAGARVFHVDIGDGHFIPPVTIGSVVVEAMRPLVSQSEARLDCHLMVSNPDDQIPVVAASGADSITFHIEASADPRATVALAREQGVAVGVTLNPSTPVEALAPIAEEVDLALLMSVVPGYSGQSFLPESIERARELRELVGEGCRVEIDGGIGPATIEAARDAGADVLVAGSSIFGSADPAEVYRELVALLG